MKNYMQLFNEYNNIVNSIKGWYSYEDINPILYSIHMVHQQQGIKGDICEIGIYQGRFFLALCCVKQDSEVCIAIDSFGYNPDTDWMYGDGENNKKIFEDNYNRLFGHDSPYILIQKTSKEISSLEISKYLKNKVRFFSIDGDHTLSGAYYDLELSKSLLSDYGTIIVDDYTNTSWPEVKQATDIFLDNNKDISILKIYANKIFLCYTKNHTHLTQAINNYV